MSLTLIAVAGIFLGFAVILAGFVIDDREKRPHKKPMRRKAA